MCIRGKGSWSQGGGRRHRGVRQARLSGCKHTLLQRDAIAAGRATLHMMPTAVAGSAQPVLETNAVRELLRSRGLRWTPQRRTLVEILAATRGHVTATELLERCRERDPATIPSTVYRTMDVLEQVGLVRHAHGPDGREEFHVLPAEEHGHLHCQACGRAWEIDASDGRELLAALERQRRFAVDLSHLTIVGTCADCRAKALTRTAST